MEGSAHARGGVEAETMIGEVSGISAPDARGRVDDAIARARTLIEGGDLNGAMLLTGDYVLAERRLADSADPSSAGSYDTLSSLHRELSEALHPPRTAVEAA